MLISPYLADCWLSGEYQRGLEVTELNKHTIWVRVGDRQIKRHASKHNVVLTYIDTTR